MRLESRERDVHDILEANSRVFFVKLKTLHMHMSVRKEKGVERCKPICGESGRKEVGRKIKGEIINLSSYILIMFTLITMIVKCYTFPFIE